MPDQTIATEVNGTTIYIETEPNYGVEQTSAAEKAIEQVGSALEGAKTVIGSVANELSEYILSLDNKITPDSFALEFGIKFSAEGSVIVSKVGAEATIKVTMTYNHHKGASQP